MITVNVMLFIVTNFLLASSAVLQFYFNFVAHSMKSF